MFFSLRKEEINFPLHLNNTPILMVKTIKYLGINLQENLKWNDTLLDKIKSLVKLKYLFKFLKSCLPKDKLLLLYNSLVISKLTYGIEFYGENPQYLLNRLQIIQNTFLKIILKKNNLFSTSLLHSIAQVLKINDLIYFRQCMIF